MRTEAFIKGALLSILIMSSVTLALLFTSPSITAMDDNQLTTSPYTDATPEWSPDGSKIVYHAYDSSGWYRHIWLMNADGSNKTQLTFGNLVDVNPSFSPDGSKIIFCRWGLRGDYTDLMIMDIDGQNVRRLTYGPNGVMYTEPQFSPDSQKILFTLNYGTTATFPRSFYIGLMDANTIVYDLTDIQILAPGASPRWENNGQDIVYSLSSDNRSPYGYIMIMKNDGTNIRQLTTGPYDGNPDISPDGFKIVFHRTLSLEEIWTTTDLYFMNRDGTYLEQLTTDGKLNYDPSFSPSTEGGAYKVLYVSGRTGNQDIWTIKIAPPAPDTTPPVSRVNPLENYWRLEIPVTITANASDPSGVENVELWYRCSPDVSAWSAWKLYDTDKNGADGWSWTFGAPDRDGYYQFYSIGTDTLGNRESAPSEADAKCAIVIAERWFPYLRFSWGEPNYPCSFYFDGDNDVTNNPSNYDKAKYLPLFYAYVHPVVDETRFTIQYWFYYADQKKVGRLGHPHDWEPVLAVFKLGDLSKPDNIGWGRHGRIIYHPYDFAEKVGTHPVSYVARDTHANYPKKWTEYWWGFETGNWLPGGFELSVYNFNLYRVGDLASGVEFVMPDKITYGMEDEKTLVIDVYKYRYFTDVKLFGGIVQPEPAMGAWPEDYPEFGDWAPWLVPDFRGRWDGLNRWYEYYGQIWDETRPDPDRELWTGIIACQADLHVYDSFGRHVGINYENGEIETQIPGSMFDLTSEGQRITIHYPHLDNCRVEIVGKENEVYSFYSYYWENGAPVWEFNKENIPITEGETHVLILNPWTSPRALKVRSLQRLLGAGGNNRVIKHLQRSLDNLWIDDWHIVQKQGFRVFLEEFISVNFMQIEMKWGRVFMELKTTYLQTIDNLVEADKMLARTAIDEAKGLIVTDPLRQKLVERVLAMAERKFGEALADVSKNRPNLAILKFGEAWKCAQLASKLARYCELCGEDYVT